MTRIILTRHGASAWHRENRYAGSSDIGLSLDGEKQAAALATWARHAHLDAIVTSPMARCRRTARPSEEILGLTALVDDRFRELDFGAAEGLTKAELRSRYPNAWAAFEVDPVGDHLPEGESPRDAVDRLREGLDAIIQPFPDGRVLLIGHSTASRLILCDLLEIPLERYRSTFPTLVNCALTRINHSHGRASLLTLNEEPRPQTTGENL